MSIHMLQSPCFYRTMIGWGGRHPPVTTAAGLSSCTCYPATATANPSPPPADGCHRPFPTLLRLELTRGGRCVHRSPKRQRGRWRGGCVESAPTMERRALNWPLPTTSWRTDENTAGAPQGGNEAKKERYRARSEKRGQNWGKKSKDDEFVSGVGGRRGGKAGWGIGGVLQEERRGSARVVVVTECNARRRAFRAGADRWRWGPQDKRPRAVRSAEMDRCVEETSSPQECLGGQRTWIRPPPSLKMIGQTTPGSFCGADPLPNWINSS